MNQLHPCNFDKGKKPFQADEKLSTAYFCMDKLSTWLSILCSGKIYILKKVDIHPVAI